MSVELTRMYCELTLSLRDAQTRAAAVEQSLADLNEKHPDVAKHVQSEAEVRQLYAQAQDRLEKYERVYGSGSGSNGAGPSDTKSLMDMLAEKEEALRKMKSLKRQHDEQVRASKGRPYMRSHLTSRRRMACQALWMICAGRSKT